MHAVLPRNQVEKRRPADLDQIETINIIYNTYMYCILGLGEKSKIKIKTCAVGF